MTDVPAGPQRVAVDQRVELRLCEPADASALFAVVDAERQRLRQWLPWVDGTRALEDLRDYLSGPAQAPGALTYTVWCDGAAGGSVGVRRSLNPATPTADIGYWLGSAYEGRGTITRSAAALTALAFDTLGIHRVEIRCATGNRRSRAVPERLGFRHEGTLRDAEWLPHGFVDLELYALLSTDRVTALPSGAPEPPGR